MTKIFAIDSLLPPSNVTECWREFSKLQTLTDCRTVQHLWRARTLWYNKGETRMLLAGVSEYWFSRLYRCKDAPVCNTRHEVCKVATCLLRSVRSTRVGTNAPAVRSEGTPRASSGMKFMWWFVRTPTCGLRWVEDLVLSSQLRNE